MSSVKCLGGVVEPSFVMARETDTVCPCVSVGSVSDGSLAGCIHDFAKVLMLLFVLQLSAAAMYLMLIAQLIAVSGFTMMLR